MKLILKKFEKICTRIIRLQLWLIDLEVLYKWKLDLQLVTTKFVEQFYSILEFLKDLIKNKF